MSDDLHKIVNGKKVPLTAEEEKEFYDNLAIHEKKLEEKSKLFYLVQRKNEYPKDADRLNALWAAANGDSTLLKVLQAKIVSIDIKYPPPN